MNLLKYLFNNFTKRFKVLFKPWLFIKVGKKGELIILDDIIPSLLSPWRTYEFNFLLKRFPNSVVLADLRNFTKYNLGLSFEKSLEKLVQSHSFFENRVKKINTFNVINHRIAYTIFYMNIVRYFPYFEKNKMNFFFTLYPGGGFLLDNEEVNNTLKKICSSVNFKGIIVNQNFIKNYLVDHSIVKPECIHLIHGIPFQLNLDKDLEVNFKDFSQEVTILFFANKYKSGSTDKGWLVFQEVVSKLIGIRHEVKFMVIGGYSDSDLDYKDLVKLVEFKGSLEESEYSKILNDNAHILISPNAPNLSNGAFDGFPLGTCVSAGYYFNALLMTDFFEESRSSGWEDGVNFIRISQNADIISLKIKELLDNREKLENISYGANSLIRENYSYENQVLSRIKIFESALI